MCIHGHTNLLSRRLIGNTTYVHFFPEVISHRQADQYTNLVHKRKYIYIQYLYFMVYFVAKESQKCSSVRVKPVKPTATHNRCIIQCCGAVPFWPGSGSGSSSSSSHVHSPKFVAKKKVLKNFTSQFTLLCFIHRNVGVLCFALPLLY